MRSTLSNIAQNGLKRSETVQNGLNRPKTVRNDLKQSKMVENGLKRPKAAQNGFGLSLNYFGLFQTISDWGREWPQGSRMWPQEGRGILVRPPMERKKPMVPLRCNTATWGYHRLRRASVSRWFVTLVSSSVGSLRWSVRQSVRSSR